METHNKIAALKYQLNQILSEKISKVFTFTKQTYFEFGDKPHKLLARQLRKRESDRTIHTIKSESGTTVTSHRDINNTFCQFYEKLYTSQANVPEVMKQFLITCKLRTLSERDKSSLEVEITDEEIRKTNNSLKNGKNPGPDGLCNELYKKFSNIIVPYLQKMYKMAFEVSTLSLHYNTHSKDRERFRAGRFI